MLNELVRLTSEKGVDTDMETIINLMNQLATIAWQVVLIQVSILVHKYFDDNHH